MNDSEPMIPGLDSDLIKKRPKSRPSFRPSTKKKNQANRSTESHLSATQEETVKDVPSPSSNDKDEDREGGGSNLPGALKAESIADKNVPEKVNATEKASKSAQKGIKLGSTMGRFEEAEREAAAARAARRRGELAAAAAAARRGGAAAAAAAAAQGAGRAGSLTLAAAGGARDAGGAMGIPRLGDFCTSYRVDPAVRAALRPASRHHKRGKKRSIGQTVLPEGARTQKAEPKQIAPQVEIINGQIIIQESSLLVHQPDIDETQFEEVYEDQSMTATYHSYTNWGKSDRWGVEETKRFYFALRQCGTDFSMMTHLFPGRTRAALKRKLHREDRARPRLVGRFLGRAARLDLENFENSLGSTFSCKLKPEEKHQDKANSNDASPIKEQAAAEEDSSKKHAKNEVKPLEDAQQQTSVESDAEAKGRQLAADGGGEGDATSATSSRVTLLTANGEGDGEACEINSRGAAAAAEERRERCMGDLEKKGGGRCEEERRWHPALDPGEEEYPVFEHPAEAEGRGLFLV